MKRHSIILIVSLSFLISCKKDYVLNTIVIYDNMITTQNDTTNIDFEKIINGEFSYNLNKSIVKNGTLEKSMNIGTWNYEITNQKQKIDTSFVWNIKQKNNFKISYPSDWALIQNNDTKRLFTFNLSPKIDRKILDDEFLVVLKHPKGNKTLIGYNSYHNKEINKKNEIGNIDSFKVTIDNKVMGYFNRFTTVSGNYILNYNFESIDSIFDISLKTSSIDNEAIHQLLFFEFIRNFNINERPILNRKGTLKIE